jgi:superfamily II DNA helicase RecQ
MEVSDDDPVDDDTLEEMTRKVEQTGHIVKRVKHLFDIDAKAGQVEALRHLLYDKKDLILIASTGFGKSTIFKSAPLMREDLKHTALIIMPLKAIEQEQCESLNNIEGAVPFVLDGDTNIRKNLIRIGAGEFTHGMDNLFDV